jgi:hypothetical protein
VPAPFARAASSRAIWRWLSGEVSSTDSFAGAAISSPAAGCCTICGGFHPMPRVSGCAVTYASSVPGERSRIPVCTGAKLNSSFCVIPFTSFGS